MTTPVRDIAESEMRTAGALLARAFMADPLWLFVFPDEATRSQKLAPLAETWIRCAQLYGKAWTTAGLEGVALRRRPGKYDLGMWSLLRSGMIKTPWLIGQEPFKRLEQIVTEMTSRHSKAASALGSHWYAWALAVDPAHQGRGFGGALMAHTFEHARGHAMYLETATEKNVAVHGKHGYRVLSDEVIPGSDLRMWTMMRAAEPR